MGLDWPYAAESTKQHHSPVPDLEPQGKRKRGRPRNSWRHNTDAEMKVTGFTWKEVERKAQARVRWREVVNGLCSTWSNGPKKANEQATLPASLCQLGTCLDLHPSTLFLSHMFFFWPESWPVDNIDKNCVASCSQLIKNKTAISEAIFFNAGLPTALLPYLMRRAKGRSQENQNRLDHRGRFLTFLGFEHE